MSFNWLILYSMPKSSKDKYPKEIQAAIELLEARNFIVIDPLKEVTIKDYSDTYGVPMSTITTWIEREQIEFRILKDLNNLKLVKVGTKED